MSELNPQQLSEAIRNAMYGGKYGELPHMEGPVDTVYNAFEKMGLLERQKKTFSSQLTDALRPFNSTTGEGSLVDGLVSNYLPGGQPAMFWEMCSTLDVRGLIGRAVSPITAIYEGYSNGRGASVKYIKDILKDIDSTRTEQYQQVLQKILLKEDEENKELNEGIYELAHVLVDETGSYNLEKDLAYA
ncbi:MAG: hypothetical protein KJ906_00330 [Nanoarchaeota archaeon]|nr:hypothetical protein [Nanoarchaeota archaeon]